MENFGIICLFIIMMSALLGSFYGIIKIANKREYEDAEFCLVLVILVDVFLLYAFFHKGLWAVIHGHC